PFLISIVVYTIILIIGWPMLPHIVQWLLPNYTQGVPAAQWMFVVALLSSFGVFSNIFMVVQKNQHRLVGYVLGMLAWFVYLNFNSIQGIEDLVIFSQAVLVGVIFITLSDFTYYLLYFN